VGSFKLTEIKKNRGQSSLCEASSIERDEKPPSEVKAIGRGDAPHHIAPIQEESTVERNPYAPEHKTGMRHIGVLLGFVAVLAVILNALGYINLLETSAYTQFVLPAAVVTLILRFLGVWPFAADSGQVDLN
jgi:hypothetical protein